MKQGIFRQRIFRVLMVVLVLVILEACGYLAMWINSQSFDWLSNKNYFRIRFMLLGEKEGERKSKYLSVPFLGYIPNPGYEKMGVVQHNDQGYRGKGVSLNKTSKLRILCMGGSTTYGLGVDYPEQTYPARLETLLNNAMQTDTALTAVFTGCEVMNAGLEAGTSAEELQQFLFKYRYYKPDLVIVHSGVNDAEIMSSLSPDFQLDYTHYRRLQFHLEALPSPARWFMRSYFISFCVIRLFYENFYFSGMSGRECYTRQLGQSYATWTAVNMDSVFSNKKYDYHPFYRNTQSLYDAIKKEGCQLFVLPQVLNGKDQYVKDNPIYANHCESNNYITKRLAADYGGVVIPFVYSSITDSSNWIDDCHLNAAGEDSKARLLFPYIIQWIETRGSVPEAGF